MRRSMIMMSLTASAASMMVLSGTASAQGVDVYVGPGYDGTYDYRPYRSYYYAPPAYGYSYRSDRGYFARPERYRYGTRRWWRQMDRNGRGGHHD